jgi:hypothetical protein
VNRWERFFFLREKLSRLDSPKDKAAKDRALQELSDEYDLPLPILREIVAEVERQVDRLVSTTH